MLRLFFIFVLFWDTVQQDQQEQQDVPNDCGWYCAKVCADLSDNCPRYACNPSVGASACPDGATCENHCQHTDATEARNVQRDASSQQMEGPLGGDFAIYLYAAVAAVGGVVLAAVVCIWYRYFNCRCRCCCCRRKREGQKEKKKPKEPDDLESAVSDAALENRRKRLEEASTQEEPAVSASRQRKCHGWCCCTRRGGKHSHHQDHPSRSGAAHAPASKAQLPSTRAGTAAKTAVAANVQPRIDLSGWGDSCLYGDIGSTEQRKQEQDEKCYDDGGWQAAFAKQEQYVTVDNDSSTTVVRPRPPPTRRAHEASACEGPTRMGSVPSAVAAEAPSRPEDTPKTATTPGSGATEAKRTLATTSSKLWQPWRSWRRSQEESCRQNNAKHGNSSEPLNHEQGHACNPDVRGADEKGQDYGNPHVGGTAGDKATAGQLLTAPSNDSPDLDRAESVNQTCEEFEGSAISNGADDASMQLHGSCQSQTEHADSIAPTEDMNVISSSDTIPRVSPGAAGGYLEPILETPGEAESTPSSGRHITRKLGAQEESDAPTEEQRLCEKSQFTRWSKYTQVFWNVSSKLNTRSGGASINGAEQKEDDEALSEVDVDVVDQREAAGCRQTTSCCGPWNLIVNSSRASNTSVENTCARKHQPFEASPQDNEAGNFKVDEVSEASASCCDESPAGVDLPRQQAANTCRLPSRWRMHGPGLPWRQQTSNSQECEAEDMDPQPTKQRRRSPTSLMPWSKRSRAGEADKVVDVEHFPPDDVKLAAETIDKLAGCVSTLEKLCAANGGGALENKNPAVATMAEKLAGCISELSKQAPTTSEASASMEQLATPDVSASTLVPGASSSSSSAPATPAVLMLTSEAQPVVLTPRRLGELLKMIGGASGVDGLLGAEISQKKVQQTPEIGSAQSPGCADEAETEVEAEPEAEAEVQTRAGAEPEGNKNDQVVVKKATCTADRESIARRDESCFEPAVASSEARRPDLRGSGRGRGRGEGACGPSDLMEGTLLPFTPPRSQRGVPEPPPQDVASEGDARELLQRLRNFEPAKTQINSAVAEK